MPKDAIAKPHARSFCVSTTRNDRFALVSPSMHRDIVNHSPDSPAKSGAREHILRRTVPMHYRNLGRSGLKISPICLGTMMFGGPTDEATSTRIVAKAREAGINFIDTADAYNGGNSEQVVGRAISNNRHNWVLATKLANPMGDDPNRGGLSRRWVLQAADESLKRLGTDTIDIYYLHKEDHSTPLQETVRAMGELIQQGKVRYFGVSNYRAWRVAEICNIC